jgi:hypothetical protein
LALSVGHFLMTASLAGDASESAVSANGQDGKESAAQHPPQMIKILNGITGVAEGVIGDGQGGEAQSGGAQTLDGGQVRFVGLKLAPRPPRPGEDTEISKDGGDDSSGENAGKEDSIENSVQSENGAGKGEKPKPVFMLQLDETLYLAKLKPESSEAEFKFDILAISDKKGEAASAEKKEAEMKILGNLRLLYEKKMMLHTFKGELSIMDEKKGSNEKLTLFLSKFDKPPR